MRLVIELLQKLRGATSEIGVTPLNLKDVNKEAARVLVSLGFVTVSSSLNYDLESEIWIAKTGLSFLDFIEASGTELVYTEPEPEVEAEPEKEYTLVFTPEDVATCRFVGNRYCWSSVLKNLDADTHTFGESEARGMLKEFEKDTEGGHTMFPMLDMRSSLANELTEFVYTIKEGY